VCTEHHDAGSAARDAGERGGEHEQQYRAGATHSKLSDTSDVIRVIKFYTHIVCSLSTLKDNLYQLQPTTATTIVFVDTTAGNTLHRERSRHIGLRKYYVRELVQDKLVKLMPCGTKEMVADALTKSLPYLPFRTHRNTMLDATSLQSSV